MKIYLFLVVLIGTSLILIFSMGLPAKHYAEASVSNIYHLHDSIASKTNNSNVFNENMKSMQVDKSPSLANMTMQVTNSLKQAKHESVSVPVNLQYVHYEDKKICPDVPPINQGPIKLKMQNISMQEVESLYPQLELGGLYRPKECKARQFLAMILPFRNRTHQLKIFLHNIHDFLMKQQLHYQIFLVEQESGKKFNRAKLFNVGFAEAMKRHPFDCILFHDIDLLPEDARNLYRCSDKPRHLTKTTKEHNYRLAYEETLAGAFLFKSEQYELINGLSNEYWGWGGEDNDAYERVKLSGLGITNYSPEIARYTNIVHKKEEKNPKRFEVLSKAKIRHKIDGLNNLKYERKDIQFQKLFTWILVDI